MLVQIASGMTTELQNGWSAHAPVGDEQRTVTAELGAWDLGGGIFYHRAHQGTQGLVGNAEGEQ